jgi:DNA-binding transcriptional LysR family regulator
VLEYRFVSPTYWTAEGLVRGNDQFPVAASKRNLGFETATADAAIPVLLSTDQVAFLPEVLAQAALRSKLLKVIPMKAMGLDEVERELFLTVRTDIISSRFQKTLIKHLKSALK